MHAETNTSTTTMQLRHSSMKRLAPFRDPLDRNWDAAVERATSNHGDVYFKVLVIDGLLADSSGHEVLFQLGDDPPCFYRYFNGKVEELEELPKMKVESLLVASR